MRSMDPPQRLLRVQERKAQWRAGSLGCRRQARRGGSGGRPFFCLKGGAEYREKRCGLSQKKVFFSLSLASLSSSAASQGRTLRLLSTKLPCTASAQLTLDRARGAWTPPLGRSAAALPSAALPPPRLQPDPRRPSPQGGGGRGHPVARPARSPLAPAFLTASLAAPRQPSHCPGAAWLPPTQRRPGPSSLSPAT